MTIIHVILLHVPPVQDALIRSLIDRFKEFRRPKKPRTPLSNRAKEKERGKKPGITNTIKEPIPLPGEDMISFERHTKALQVEFKRANRNNAVINDLMNRSFALRRAEILEKPHDLASFFNKFPFLQEPDQVGLILGYYV